MSHDRVLHDLVKASYTRISSTEKFHHHSKSLDEFLHSPAFVLRRLYAEKRVFEKSNLSQYVDYVRNDQGNIEYVVTYGRLSAYYECDSKGNTILFANEKGHIIHTLYNDNNEVKFKWQEFNKDETKVVQPTERISTDDEDWHNSYAEDEIEDTDADSTNLEIDLDNQIITIAGGKYRLIRIY